MERSILSKGVEIFPVAHLDNARTPDVSIITACRNGAATLPRMFESLERQRHRAWEVIVVDDGSTDASREIVQEHSRRDSRVRLLSQAHAGVSVARNRGIAAASGERILFLDCDDWLASNALLVLLEAARRHAAAGVIVGRAVSILPDGRRSRSTPCDLSEPFAFLCAEGRLAIHSILVRRDLVVEASGFDPDLKTHEDWDLWQRLARSGARFVQIPSDVAFHRPRSDSLSRNVRQTTVDGLTVLRRGHAPDPRVARPVAAHAVGAPPEALPSRQLQFLMWSAARDIALGGDGVGLLSLTDFESEVLLDPPFLGTLMASGMADVAVCAPAELGRRWSEFEPKLAALLDAAPGAKRQPRLKALTLATIRAQLDADAPGAVEVRLERRDPLGEGVGRRPPSVLLLKGRRGSLGAVATPALGPMGRKTLERTILAQARRLPLRGAVRGLAPWRSLAFHVTSARRLADLSGFALSGVTAERLKALARMRLRSAVASGVQAVLRERLAGAPDASDVCPHTLALNALTARAKAGAMVLPALSQELPRRREFRREHGELRDSVPILTYHRVAPDGPKPLARYRVTPDRFAQQIRHLRTEGFRSVLPEELLDAISTNRPLRGRPVMLTFDDGYADFAEHAWPILDEYGFTAVLFVVSDRVGTAADWDAGFGEPAPLLDWAEIAALAKEGVSIESHSATHRPLASLETEDLYWEALSSAAAIERVVGRRPMAFSYPFGALDPVVERVVEECGYQLGFAATSGVCSLASDPLRLTRLEMTEADDPVSLSRKIRGA